MAAALFDRSVEQLSSSETAQVVQALSIVAKQHALAAIDPAKHRAIALELLSIPGHHASPELIELFVEALSPLLHAISTEELQGSAMARHVKVAAPISWAALQLATSPAQAMRKEWCRTPAGLVRALDVTPPVLLARALPELVEELVSGDIAAMRESFALCSALVAAIDRCVVALALSPAQGGAILQRFVLELAYVEPIRPALDLYARAGWAVLTISRELEARLRQLASTSQPCAPAIVLIFARRGGHEALRLMFHDPRHDSIARTRALMKALASCGDKEDLAHLIDRTMEAPESLADTLYEALLTFHHRGIFVERAHLDVLLALYLSTRHTPARHVVEIAHIWRHELRALLAGLHPDDWRWRRHAALLEFIEGGEALLATLILGTTEPLLLEIFAEMAPRLPDRATLARPLFTRVLQHPRAVSEAFAACAGGEHFEALHALLKGEDHAFDTLPVPVQVRLIELAWRLAPTREVRQALASSMTLHVWRSSVLADVLVEDVSTDDATLRLLAEVRVERAPVEQRLHELFVLLCEHGSITAHLVLVKRLLETLLGTLPETTDGEYSGREEGTIPDAILDALALLYRRHEQAAMLRGAASLPGDGEDGFVQDMLLDLVTGDGAERAPHHLWMTLEALPTPLSHARSARLLPLFRHDSPRVRRSLVRVLAKSRAPGLLVRFYHYLDQHEDPETLRAVIEALDDPEMTWASSAVALGLGHRNMNIKSSAARALRRIGQIEQVGTILDWLGRHDHERFRAELVAALEHIVGDSWRALVMARVEVTTEDRARSLLEEAIAQTPPPDLRASSPSLRDSMQREVEPVSWLLALEALPLEQRAHQMAHLDQITTSAQVADRYLSSLLEWAREDAFEVHRADVFTWVLRHLDASSRARRVELLAHLRAIGPAPLCRKPQRARLYQELGALLTSEDRRRCLADARIGKSPARLLRDTASILLDVRAPRELTVASAAHAALDELGGMSSVEQMERALTTQQPHRGMIDDLTDALLLRIEELEPTAQEDLLSALIHVRAIQHHLAVHDDSERVGAPSMRRSEELFEQLRAGTIAARIDAVHELTTRFSLPAAREREVLRSCLDEPEVARAPSLQRALSTLLDRYLSDVSTSKLLDERLAITLATLCLSMGESASRRAIGLMITLWERLRVRVDDARRRELVHALLAKLRSMDAMEVLGACIARIEAGHTELVSLIGGRLVDSTLTARLFAAPGVLQREDGRCLQEELLPPLLSRKEALSDLESYVRDRLEELSHQTPPTSSGLSPAGEDELLAMLRGGDEERILLALRHMPRTPHEPFARAILELVSHRDGGVRSRAYRTLRQMRESERYLQAAAKMLHDPRRDVQRAALRTLGFAKRTETIPEVFERLFDPFLREQAMETLVLMGEPARRFLRKRRARTRPDARHIVDEALERF